MRVPWRRMHCDSSRRGFTLVEVLLSIGLLGFVVLAIAQLFLVGMHTQSSSERRMLMITRAQQQMEILTALDLQQNPPELSQRSLNSACMNWNQTGYVLMCYGATDDNHRWPPQNQLDTLSQECKCVIVWEAFDAQNPSNPCQPDRSCMVRMIVMPYPEDRTVRPQMLISVVR